MKFYSSFVLLFFCFCRVSLAETQNHGFGVELIHPISSKSPFYNTAETQFQRISNIVKHSINRVSYLNHVFSFPQNQVSDIALSPFMGAGYMINYSIGTPPFQLYGLIDTANNNIWFQCKPCKPCFNQTSPMFDPSKSSTYKTIPCSSHTCKHAENTHCSADDKKKCEYNYLYGGGASSQGDLSVDTLTLNSNNGTPISFQNIVLGCSFKNKGPLQGYVTGNIGLGRRSLSLISQLKSSIGEKFSYCLVPLFSTANISGKLYFGDKSVVSGSGTVSTPIQGNISYFTTLEAFSVGDHIIKLEHSSFTNSIQGNTLIDSGSTLTVLPNDVLSKLESVVASMVKLKRVKDPTQRFNLCYKTTLKMLEVPIITAHFSGANVHLNAINTFYPITHEVVCFAFISNGKFPGAIFGNIAQQNFLVGFDNKKNIISFKPTDCTNH